MNDLSNVKRFAVLAAVFAAGLVLAVAAITGSVGAQQPGAKGGNSNNPIEIPGDEDVAVETDNASPPEWRYAYVHNDSGKGPDNVITGEGAQDDIPAKFLNVTVKQNPKDGSPRKNRVIVKDAEVWDATEQKWKSIAETIVPAEGDIGAKDDVERVVITLNPEAGYCTTIRVTYKVQQAKRGISANSWGDYKSDTGATINTNYALLDGSNAPLPAANGGDVPVTTGEGEQKSIGDIFDGIEPPANTAPSDAEAGEAAEAVAPDLVVSEGSGWLMPEGDLRFYALGGASFDSESNLQLIVRDAMGNDPVASFDAGFGTPSVIDGVIVVPVTYRNPNAVYRIAVMVRGAIVDLPALHGGTMISYAIGGTSAGSGSVRTPPLVRVGGEPSGELFRSRVVIDAPADAEDPEITIPVSVGGVKYAIRPSGTGIQEGFLDAIVLRESEDGGTFRSGTFEITPTDSFFSFVASEHTKLYVVNADDDSQAEGFESAEIAVTASGALRVTLGPRTTVGPLKLVILNPRLNMGQAPFAYGHNARVAMCGDALRGGFKRSMVLVEGGPQQGEEGYSLNDATYEASALTPLASVETE